MQSSRPENLSQIDFVRLRFVLEFVSSCRLQPSVFANLKGSIRLAGRQILEDRNREDCLRWNEFFQPSLSADPVALRKFQKPSPAFVLQWPFVEERLIAGGDHVDLDVLFLGTGIPLIHDFSRSLVHLGNLGLVSGGGFYRITEIKSVANDLSWQRVWSQKELISNLVPNVLSLDLWLDKCLSDQEQLVLNFVTPARLLVGGKPLRSPKFTQVFPFIVRRVTSMLHAHCGVEVVDTPADLFRVATNIESSDSSLSWYDWRSISTSRKQSLGGFTGKMFLSGQALKEIDWLLATATLFGIGKGSAYGAGQLCLG